MPKKSGSTPSHPIAPGVGQEQPLLTARDVADYLQIPFKKVYHLPIPRIQLSRRVRYHAADVAEYVNRRRVGAL